MALVSKISRVKSDAVIAPFSSNELTLEVGAYGQPGYGRFFPNRIGIDIRKGPGVDRVASVYALPFSDGYFANVLCMSVLEHLEDPARAIREMHRVLKPGGRIFVSVPFLFPIHDAPGDYWRFTKYGLQYLFREGWNVVHLRAETDAQESFAVLLQRYGYQTKLRWNTFFKGVLFMLARILDVMPRSIIRSVYGDIHKKREEPDAFASAFFLAAEKR
jgi:SAM-dependent methyltransferase